MDEWTFDEGVKVGRIVAPLWAKRGDTEAGMYIACDTYLSGWVRPDGWMQGVKEGIRQYYHGVKDE